MSSRKRSDEKQLPKQLAELERALALFEPLPSCIHRDRLMFEAGAACGIARASTAHERSHAPTTRGRRSEPHRCPRAVSPRTWPMATAAAALVACTFASLYFVERDRPPMSAHEVVFVEPEPPDRELATDSRPSASDDVAAAIGKPASADRSLRSLHRSPYFFNLASVGANPTSNYLALRHLVLMRGIDALPQREYTGDPGPLSELRRPPATVRTLMKEFLPGSATEFTKETDGTSRQESTHDDMRGTI